MKQTKEQNERVAAEAGSVVTVYLPGDDGAFIEGALNGVNFRIPANTAVEVPARIAAILKESRRTLLEGGRAVEAFQALGGRRIG